MSQFFPSQSPQSQSGQQYPQQPSQSLPDPHQQWQQPTMYAPPNAPSSPQPPLYTMPSGQPPVYPQPPKKRKSRKKLWLIIGVVLAIVVIASAASQKGNTTPSSDTTTTSSQTTTTAQQPTQPQTQVTQSQPAQTSSQPTTAPSTPTVNYAQFDDGTYAVGKDIQPGTYRTRTASAGCYFARLSGFGGTIGEIIANANTDAPAIVTIKATDKGFTSTNCGTWTKDLSAITTSKTSFGDGMYIVGTDIQPGTYKNSGQVNCYYARLSGFGGTTDEIIANDNTDASTIVTISASDKGFEASSCGTWTKV